MLKCAHQYGDWQNTRRYNGALRHLAGRGVDSPSVIGSLSGLKVETVVMPAQLECLWRKRMPATE